MGENNKLALYNGDLGAIGRVYNPNEKFITVSKNNDNNETDVLKNNFKNKKISFIIIIFIVFSLVFIKILEYFNYFSS